MKNSPALKSNIFWQEHPALLIGLSLLIGSGSFLFWQAPWNGVWPLLWIAYLISLRAWPHLPLVLGAIVYSWCLYPTTMDDPKGLVYFSLHSLQPNTTPFHKNLVYQGTLFSKGSSIPCRISHPLENRPRADCDYLLAGHFMKKDSYSATFKAKEWIAVEKSWSLAELRYRSKEAFRKLLEKKLPSPRAATFLSSLITGDVEDRSLRYEFGKLGLQHVLAISGFHFSILIAFCSGFLQWFFRHRWTTILLLLLINLYFLFVGSLPAVQRSWLTASLYLVGKLIGRQTSGLNLLGVSLAIEVLLNPWISAHLGFQLSFLSCAGILLFYPKYEALLLPLAPRRNLGETLEFSLVSQHIYLLATWLRKGISLTLAVNTAILPLLLYHFHQFPLLGLLYNLFFPLLVSVALFALLFTFVIYLVVPFLAPPLFFLTDRFTTELLNLTAYPPVALDYSLKISAFPAWMVPLYLFGLFYLLTNSGLSGKILSFYGGRSSAG